MTKRLTKLIDKIKVKTLAMAQDVCNSMDDAMEAILNSSDDKYQAMKQEYHQHLNLLSFLLNLEQKLLLKRELEMMLGFWMQNSYQLEQKLLKDLSAYNKEIYV